VVSGAAGFIGSHLCERLVGEGWEVRGLDCFTPYYAQADKRANLAQLQTRRRFEFFEADVRTAGLGWILAEADAVFHLAAQPGVRLSWSDDF
jgi:nucleoside-diphosphate-sugar epimerase